MKNCLLAFLLFPFILQAQLEDKFQLNAKKVSEMVTSLKNDVRGPYRDIRWFCDDGSINMPKEPCEDGGVQHARYKESVIELGEISHIFLGQILASSDPQEFWDSKNFHAKLKQYQLEQYLKRVDEGWIHQKSQFYWKWL